jgi:hypothetical protein
VEYVDPVLQSQKSDLSAGRMSFDLCPVTDDQWRVACVVKHPTTSNKLDDRLIAERHFKTTPGEL